MLTLGITSFLSQISLVAAMAAINNMLRKYGALDPVFGQAQYAQIPMAVVAIVMKFFQIVISIVVGMAAGCIPIVGYNMGAEKRLRVRQLFTRLLIAEAAVGAVALLLAECFPRSLIAIFGAANESSYYTDFALRAFRIYLSMVVLACVNKACFIFLQAVGKALASTLLSMIREVVFGVGFCPAAAGLLRAGRRSVLHAGVRCADLPHCRRPHPADLPLAGSGRAEPTRIAESLSASLLKTEEKALPPPPWPHTGPADGGFPPYFPADAYLSSAAAPVGMPVSPDVPAPSPASVGARPADR